MKFRSYSLVMRAVEEGLLAGFRKAHKYTDSPDQDTLLEYQRNYISLALSEIFNFEEDANARCDD